MNRVPLDPDTVSSYDYTVDDVGRRTAVAMAGDAFSGTPTWAWQYNATGEATAADHGTADTTTRTYAGKSFQSPCDIHCL